jgi:hypothetical protein
MFRKISGTNLVGYTLIVQCLEKSGTNLVCYTLIVQCVEKSVEQI